MNDWEQFHNDPLLSVGAEQGGPMSSTGHVNDDNAYIVGPWKNDPAAVLLDELQRHEREAKRGCNCGMCRVLAALDNPPRTRDFKLSHYSGMFLS